VPPEGAAHALGLVLPDEATGRLNLTQPPQVWLVEQAAELDGWLVGSRRRGFVRFDGVQVPAAQARRPAERIAETFPRLQAIRPPWTGIGTDLLTAELPNGSEIVGLWLD
jgi:hypothetical protein